MCVDMKSNFTTDFHFPHMYSNAHDSLRLSNIPNMPEGVAMTSKKRGRWYVIRGWGARGKNEVSQKMLQIVCPSMPQLE